MANPILCLSQSGAVYPVRESPQADGRLILNSPDGSQWLSAPLATAGQGVVAWIPNPPGSGGPSVAWAKVGNSYRCLPDDGATPIAVSVRILGDAPTDKG